MPLSPGKDVDKRPIDFASMAMDGVWEAIEDAQIPVSHHIGESPPSTPNEFNALDIGMLQSVAPFRDAFGKFWLATLQIGSGASLGREGPTVQICAGATSLLARLTGLPAKNMRRLLPVGVAAGIAAAFNAPLAGVMFAIEELTRKIEQRNSGLIIAAIVLSGLMAVSVFGNSTYFGVIRVPQLGLDYALPGLLVIVSCGLLGGFFSRLLHTSIVGGNDRASRWKRKHPVAFAAGCGVVIAAIGLASSGATFGSGYDYTQRLLEGHTDMPLLYVTLRIVATWLAVWAGVPGGIFAPSLAIGAGIGNDVALLTLLGHEPSTPLIALGMTAFLAAVTQAPITAFIIVMEMVDGHAMVLSLMAAALGASLVSRWISAPLYSALAEAQLQRLLGSAASGPSVSPPPGRSPALPGA
jgi:H+/Cl- antiporter ClcA